MYSSQGKYFLIIIMFLMLVIFIPILVLRNSLSNLTILTGFVYLIIFYSSIRLFIIALNKQRKLIEMTLYIFVYIFFGIIPLIQVTEKVYYWPGIYTDLTVTSAVIIILCGIIAFDIGLFIGNKKDYSKVVLKLRVSYFKLILLSLTAIAICCLSIKVLGGFNIFLGTREGISNTFEGPTSTVLISIMRVPIFLALIFCSIYIRQQQSKKILIKNNFYTYITIILLVLINLIVSNPLTTARFWFGTIVFTFLFIFIKESLFTNTKLITTLIVILLFIFPYSDLFRYGYISDIEAKNIFVSGDFDAFQQLLNTIDYVNMNGYNYGSQMLGTFFFFIPRSLWAAKPEGTGALVAESAGYSYTNLSAPIFAEFYIDLGIISVILLFLLYGFIVARLQKLYILSRSKDSLNLYSVFIPILAAYQFFLLRGQFLSTFPTIVFILLFVWLSFRMFAKN